MKERTHFSQNEVVLVFRYHLNEDTENNIQIKLKRKKKKREQNRGKQTMYVILYRP